MWRGVTVCGVMLGGALVGARAAADALPNDPVTEVAIDGGVRVLDLEKHPAYTFVVFSGDCTDPRMHGEEMGARGTIGIRDAYCIYSLVAPGVVYRGVSPDAPNGEADAFVALPAARFPVEDGKVPALERLGVATLIKWMDGASDSPLVRLGSAPQFVVLHRLSMLTGFTDEVRVALRCGVPAFEPVRREWKLESGEVVSEPLPVEPHECEGGSAEVVTPEPVRAEVPAPAVQAPPVVVAVPTPAVQAPPVVVAVPAIAAAPASVPVHGPVMAPEVEAGFGLRSAALGSLCLLLGLGAGLSLRRRP